MRTSILVTRFHSLNRDFTLNRDSLNRDFTVLYYIFQLLLEHSLEWLYSALRREDRLLLPGGGCFEAELCHQALLMNEVQYS